MRRKSRATKAAAVAASALSTFERAAADLHYAASELDAAAGEHYDHADALFVQARAKEDAAFELVDQSIAHRRAAERIEALVTDV